MVQNTKSILQNKKIKERMKDLQQKFDERIEMQKFLNNCYQFATKTNKKSSIL